MQFRFVFFVFLLMIKISIPYRVYSEKLTTRELGIADESKRVEVPKTQEQKTQEPKRQEVKAADANTQEAATHAPKVWKPKTKEQKADESKVIDVKLKVNKEREAAEPIIFELEPDEKPTTEEQQNDTETEDVGVRTLFVTLETRKSKTVCEPFEILDEDGICRLAF